jgi:hypothetical protein
MVTEFLNVQLLGRVRELDAEIERRKSLLCQKLSRSFRQEFQGIHQPRASGVCVCVHMVAIS